jgi:hypothetical protein
VHIGREATHERGVRWVLKHAGPEEMEDGVHAPLVRALSEVRAPSPGRKVRAQRRDVCGRRHVQDQRRLRACLSRTPFRPPQKRTVGGSLGATTSSG